MDTVKGIVKETLVKLNWHEVQIVSGSPLYNQESYDTLILYHNI